MKIRETRGQSNTIVGRVLMLVVDEPTDSVALGGDTRRGTVLRILNLTNEAGGRYEVALLRLERPLEWSAHTSDVVSIMTRYTKDDLEDILENEIIVNISLEESWAQEAGEDDSRWRDPKRSFYLGYGRARLA